MGSRRCSRRRSDAVTAAVDAQERLRDVLPVRMGLHTGEAELRDGDYFGSTLNRCARLMGRSRTAAKSCAATSTAELVRDRDDLRDLGEHRLRDLSRAERVWQVGGGEFAALRSLDTAPTNLPLQSSSFVGRADEVEAVAALLAEHRLVTLTGVGGVGKTRSGVGGRRGGVAAVRGRGVAGGVGAAGARRDGAARPSPRCWGSRRRPASRWRPRW